MPVKLNFSVKHVTSEDHKFRAIELNTHGPAVKGWQSSKNCTYPQDVILHLEKQSLISTIQILAHQFLIPSKIEIFTSNTFDETVKDPNKLEWSYVGYIILHANESEGFKNRELKSANIPNLSATFVKFSLYKNYYNSHNINHQVSLIAVNILGGHIHGNCNKIGADNSSDNGVCDNYDNMRIAIDNNTMCDLDEESAFDDLAFEMYVDVDVANILRKMEKRKQMAVISERFEYARKLKKAMETLQIIGEKLGKYELEKRHAIEVENYDRAIQKKKQIDEYRKKVYDDHPIDQLLEAEGYCAENDANDVVDGTSQQDKDSISNIKNSSLSIHFNCQEDVLQRSTPSSSSPIQFSSQDSPKKSTPSSCSPTAVPSKSTFRRRNKSIGGITKSSYEMYEDKPLPTLRHSHTNEFLRGCQSDNVDSTVKHTASKLTERERKQAALPILVFGRCLVECFYAKHYTAKEDGLSRLKTELLCYEKLHNGNKTARAAIFLLHRTLRDKVFSVYNLANEVIRLFFIQFVPGRVSNAEILRSVDKLLPELLTKSGDTSARIHQMAVHTILTMADCKHVRDLNVIPVNLTRLLSSSTHPRLALSKAEMVEQLIINNGISTDKQSGMTSRTLSGFGSSGLHHPAESVRKVCERILVLVYKVNPRLVRKQLPPDDDITRRNLLYRQLFHEFDKIDEQRKKSAMEKPKPSIHICHDHTQVKNGHEEETTIVEHNNLTANNGNCELLKTNSVSLKIPPKHTSCKDEVNNGNYNHDNKTEVEAVSNSTSGISSAYSSHSFCEDQKKCTFCNAPECDILNTNKSMNSHYWRSCPMLMRCRDCSQVVEICGLTDHLILECENREKYTQCAQCTEAVLTMKLQKHLKDECTGLIEGYNKCPLCHESIADEEQCWHKHLMGDENICKKNNRTKSTLTKK